MLETAIVVPFACVLGLAVGDSATGDTLGYPLDEALGATLGDAAYGLPAPQAAANTAAAARPPVRTSFKCIGPSPLANYLANEIH